ncbi:large conductance mechanosensitive channel protein MscL [Rhodobacter sp. Har01]|uniref:large conductance mechanosensitive channel protein MscL n=1 Tax=Rhodobacter sp. Har01 TaxID=2883999 RepID=UPI001D08DAD6|nr:large conductance mechanosensitive channel protein MscL [Rhodobacter sp. Har01]MCB6177768.1 large conductance mechanosensitive channel protein MscL [Rhodobacter sp. Har01]
MLNEFKAFISKGNVLDLAVGIIIGAAFTAIVTSLVDDLIQPLIGMIIGGVDFSAWGFSIGDAKFAIGNFITAVIKFLIVAWVVFLLVKAVNKMMPKAPPAPPAPTGPSETDLLKEILAELKKSPAA